MTLPQLDDFTPDPDALYFLPLGGSGEFGVNLNLYAMAGKWLIVDLGLGFGDESTPGIDILLPDPAFIEERREDLVGILVTHAHEDHIGAVAHLWPRLQCPVYATPFTAALLKRKFTEAGIPRPPLHVIGFGDQLEIGPFALELVKVTHSIPEPNMVVLRTPAGAIVHTGDWKLDPGPVIGPTTDEARLRAIGEEGVLAMIGDSTGALTPGHSGSEAELGESLKRIIGRYHNRVVVTCFSSNVARLRSIAEAAAINDRHVALVGRSLWRIEEAARETGWLDGVPPFIKPEEVGFLPREKVVLVCTGSQGETGSALMRIAEGSHHQIGLDPGDVVIYSARAIPGNEKAIIRAQNLLMNQGIDVLTDEDDFVHVSGHPSQDEMVTMYQWIRPRVAIPVHGERHHLAAHARLARDCQVPSVFTPENGELIRLGPGQPESLGRVHSAVLALDGDRPIPMDGAIMKFRRKILYSGHVVVSLVMDRKGRALASPKLSAPSIFDRDEDDKLHDQARRGLDRLIDGLGPAERRDDEAVRLAVVQTVRRFCRDHMGKRPAVDVHIMRV